MWWLGLLACGPKLPPDIVEDAARMRHIQDNPGTYSDHERSFAQMPKGPALPESVQTLAFGSCLHQDEPAPILDAIVGLDPDLLVLLGDNVYGDSDPKDPWLSELREAYWTLAEHEAFGRLAAAVPIVSTWDDHDYGINDGGGSFEQREYAKQIFEAFWPHHEPAPMSGRFGVYSAHTFGPADRRVQVLLLDLRSYKSDFAPSPTPGEPGTERYVPIDDPERTMLGAGQWQWLETQLAQPAALRIVVSSLQVHAEGHGWERWGLLPMERDRLYAMLAERAGGDVVLVSGDRHRAGLYERPDLPGGPYLELTTSSLNLPLGKEEEAGPHRIGDTILRENFGTLDIDWSAGELVARVHGLGAEVLLHRAMPLSKGAP